MMLNLLKDDIKNAPNEEKGTLKFLYAEIERNSLKNQLSDEQIWSLVEKLISDNNNLMGQLKLSGGNDEKIERLIAENQIFNRYLPQYATKEDLLRLAFEANLSDLIGSKNPKNIGALNKLFKSKSIAFKNELVRELVMENKDG